MTGLPKTAWAILLLVALPFAVVIGGRPIASGTDTVVYWTQFLKVQACDCVIPTMPTEWGFVWLTRVAASLGLSVNAYLTLVAVLQCVAWFSVLAAYIPMLGLSRNRAVAFAFSCAALLAANPFFAATSVNVVRSGIAIPLALAGGAYLFRRQYLLAGLCGVLAAAFQLPTALGIAAAVILARLLTLRALLWLAGALSVVYLLGATASLVGSGAFVSQALTDRALALAAGSLGYRSGVRADFVLAVWIVLGLFFVLAAGSPPSIRPLGRMLTALAVPFLVMGTIAYSDRLLLPFWLFASVAFAGIVAVRIPEPLQPVVAMAGLAALLAFALAANAAGT